MAPRRFDQTEPPQHPFTASLLPSAARRACPLQSAQAGEEFWCGSFPSGPGASSEMEGLESLEQYRHSSSRVKGQHLQRYYFSIENKLSSPGSTKKVL